MQRNPKRGKPDAQMKAKMAKMREEREQEAARKRQEEVDKLYRTEYEVLIDDEEDFLEDNNNKYDPRDDL